MDRSRIDAEHWLHITQNFEPVFKGIVNVAHKVKSRITKFWDGEPERKQAADIADCKLRLS